MDLLQREGQYPLPPQAPETMGVEFSGVVESLGAETGDFKVGDEVFGLAYGGTFLLFYKRVFIGRSAHTDDAIGAYAEYIAVSTKMLVHKPKQLSWEQAAGVPEVTSIDLLQKRGRSLIRN